MAYFLATQDGKFGFVDHWGDCALPFAWDFATDFSDGIATVCAGNEWFLLGEGGEVLSAVPEVVAMGLLSGFSDGMASFKDADGRRGYLSNAGVVAIQPRFEFAGRFADGLAPVKEFGNKNGWGFIDPKGQWVISSRFEAAFSFSHGLAHVKSEGKVGFIDRDGKWRIRPTFIAARPFSDGLAAVCFEEQTFEIGGRTSRREAVKGTWGYVREDGKVAIDARYIRASSFSQNTAVVAVLLNYPYIADEELVAPCEFRYVDAAGEDCFNSRFEGAESFSEGRAAVAVGGCYVLEVGLVGGRWGFINERGEVVVEMRYEGVEAYRDGRARVYSNVRVGEDGSPYEDEFQYIDQDGEVVWASE